MRREKVAHCSDLLASIAAQKENYYKETDSLLASNPDAAAVKEATTKELDDAVAVIQKVKKALEAMEIEKFIGEKACHPRSDMLWPMSFHCNVELRMYN